MQARPVGALAQGRQLRHLSALQRPALGAGSGRSRTGSTGLRGGRPGNRFRGEVVGKLPHGDSACSARRDRATGAHPGHTSRQRTGDCHTAGGAESIEYQAGRTRSYRGSGSTGFFRAWLIARADGLGTLGASPGLGPGVPSFWRRFPAHGQLVSQHDNAAWGGAWRSSGGDAPQSSAGAPGQPDPPGGAGCCVGPFTRRWPPAQSGPIHRRRGRTIRTETRRRR
jgi:hypothetical protein